MRLFSEKVSPTFTSSNLNILTVEDFQEIFYDVFEFEINEKKFIAEKISEYKGSPVINVPLVLEGKEYNASFIIQRGEFEILFNRETATYIKDVEANTDRHIIEHTEEIEEIIFEKKEGILKEIAQARRSAEKYAGKIKQQKIDEAAQFLDDRKRAIDEEIAESKNGLLKEFLSIVNKVKSEFFEFNEIEKEKLSIFVENYISNITNELIDSIDKKQKLAEEKFSERINELAANVLSGVLLKEIDTNNTKSNKNINERFESITNSVKGLIDLNTDQIHEKINSKLSEYSDAIINLEKVNIELNDQINKGDNRALSRIGNVRAQLEETISKNISDVSNKLESTNKNIETLSESKARLETLILESETVLLSRVSEAEDKIKTFYNDKISLVEEKVEDLSLENKQYFLNLINESKQSLLNEIANIKVDVPNIIIEKSNGKKEVDLKGIKTELEKIIGTRFSNELQSLKRLIEMSSGGGSVAQQFANGGTMNGTLNVTGRYLSGGVDLFDIFSGGGGGSDDIYVNSVVRSSSANWDSVYTTVGALSTAWEESAEIIPTVTNHLSTNNVLISSVIVSDNIRGATSTTCCPHSVALGYNNSVVGSYGTIGGGRDNSTSTWSDYFGVIVTNSENTTIGGGYCNTASGDHTTIGGGYLNSIQTFSYYQNSGVNPAGATIGGGYCNIVCGTASVIAGGACNITALPGNGGGFSVIGGGLSNANNSECSVIGGGYNNTTSNYSTHATIGGGISNAASGVGSTIGGGVSNTTGGCSATVGGGASNTSSGYYSATIGGGCSNTASGSWSTIAGGYYNAASGLGSFVVGVSSVASGRSGVVLGEGNVASGLYSAIGGGNNNAISTYSGYYGPIDSIGVTLGGGVNNAACGNYATIGGGYNNITDGNGIGSNYATIGGGSYNSASSYHSTVAGGFCNTTAGRGAIGGGAHNTISGYNSTIAGGLSGIIAAGANCSTIAGGSNNKVYSSHASILGGLNNTVCSTATCSSIIAGSNIVATVANAAYAPRIILTLTPTSAAGLTSGSVWRCTTNNQLYIVP